MVSVQPQAKVQAEELHGPEDDYAGYQIKLQRPQVARPPPGYVLGRKCARREEELRQRLPELALARYVLSDQFVKEFRNGPRFRDRLLTAFRAKLPRRRRATVSAGNDAGYLQLLCSFHFSSWPKALAKSGTLQRSASAGSMRVVGVDMLASWA